MGHYLSIGNMMGDKTYLKTKAESELGPDKHVCRANRMYYANTALVISTTPAHPVGPPCL